MKQPVFLLLLSGMSLIHAQSQFAPVTPCRVMDTRNPVGPFGGPFISGGSRRDVVIPSSGCGIPSNATAYSLNITAVPRGPLVYLTVWPAGQPQPLVSTLNADTGAVTANAAIVPSGTNGAISVYAPNHTDLVIDINGYFTASAAGSGVTLALDTKVIGTRPVIRVLTGAGIVSNVIDTGSELTLQISIDTATVALKPPLVPLFGPTPKP